MPNAQAWVEKLPSGKYRGRVRFGHQLAGQTFRRKDDAREWANETARQMQRGTFVEHLAEHTVAWWWEEFQSIQVRKRETTLAKYESVMRSHILPRFGKRPLSSITSLDVAKWVSDLSKRYKPSTVGTYLRVLSGLLTAAEHKRLISSNPVRGVEVPEDDYDEDEVVSLIITPAQVWELAACMDERWSAAIPLMGFGGLRRGEMAGLRRQHVDFKRGVVSVRSQLVVARNGTVVEGPPKTKAGRRRVPLPSSALDVLLEHTTRFSQPGPSGLIFQSPQGGEMRPDLWAKRQFARAVHDAELGELSPHDLRHTAVSLWIVAGINVKEIAVRAGHTSVDRIMRIYGHLFPDAEDQFAAQLEAATQRPGVGLASVVNLR